MRIPYCALIVTVLSIGCGEKNNGKIPITTSSSEARRLYLEGRDLSEKLRIRESLSYFQQAVENDPDFALAFLALSNNAQSARDFFENLDKAESLAGDISEGERLMITAARHGASGHPGKQTEAYEKLVALFPRDERAHNLLGASYHFAEQKYEKGIEEYQKAIAINPKFSSPYNSLGYALRSLEKYDQAADAFKKYIELIPDDPNPFDSYAELLMKTGRYDESIENYRKALSVRPDFPNSYIGIACNQIYKGAYDEAMAELDRFYAVAKNDGERRTALFVKALAYVDQGKWSEAAKEIDQQYALAEKSADAGAMSGDLFVLGALLLEQGKADQAQSTFDRALKISDESSLSDGARANTRRFHLLNSGLVAIQRKDLKAARSMADDLMAQAKEAHNVFQIMGSHQLLGMIALAERNFARALAELYQANMQDPYNLYRIALAHEGKGEKKKAEEMFGKARNFNALATLNQHFVRLKMR